MIGAVTGVFRGIIRANVMMAVMLVPMMYIVGATAGLAAANPADVHQTFDEVESEISIEMTADPCASPPRPQVQCAFNEASPELDLDVPDAGASEWLRSSVLLPMIESYLSAALLGGEVVALAIVSIKPVVPEWIIVPFLDVSSFGMIGAMLMGYLYLFRARASE